MSDSHMSDFFRILPSETKSVIPMKSPSEDLAVYLILQDMRHFQFISRLEAVGFDTETQVLDLATVVAGLMGLRREDITDDWCDAYVNFLHLATAQPMEGAGEALRPLAQQCYRQMLRMGRAES